MHVIAFKIAYVCPTGTQYREMAAFFISAREYGTLPFDAPTGVNCCCWQPIHTYTMVLKTTVFECRTVKKNKNALFVVCVGR